MDKVKEEIFEITACKHLGQLVNHGAYWCNNGEQTLHCKNCPHYSPVGKMKITYSGDKEGEE